MGATLEMTIRPRRGWQWLDLGELWQNHELLGFLVWRDIKVRYKQTMLGAVWALLQPLIGMFVFGALFTKVAHIQTGAIPYSLFVFAGLVPWTFFANALSFASVSLVGSEQMIRKTYFPRMFIPLASILALGIDMLIGLAFTGLLMLHYHWHLTASILWLPFCVLGVFMSTCGLGMIFAALNVRYRDVKYALPFMIQTAFFLTPVVYPSHYIPDRFKILLGLNPMAGMLEGFRHALLGTAISITVVVTSSVISIVLFLFGLIYFHRMERSFADVI
jgi:lipopolysaccharide transport system permease protein